MHTIFHVATLITLSDFHKYIFNRRKCKVDDIGMIKKETKKILHDIKWVGVIIPGLNVHMYNSSHTNHTQIANFTLPKKK